MKSCGADLWGCGVQQYRIVENCRVELHKTVVYNSIKLWYNLV